MHEVRKHAALLFCKPPIPGLVKTRLTCERGGPFSPEEVVEFYGRCLWDVAELSMIALRRLRKVFGAGHAFDFFISTAPADKLAVMVDHMESLGQWPEPISYLTDSGATFDDHFDDAFGQLFGKGYETVVAYSADIPTLPEDHLVEAFGRLIGFRDRGTPGVVLAPCQACGTSLVGLSCDTPLNHQGIYYNKDGVPALDGYLKKVREADIPFSYLAPVPDIDNDEDLAQAISCIEALAEAERYDDVYVAQRVLDWVRYKGLGAVARPNDDRDPRESFDG